MTRLVRATVRLLGILVLALVLVEGAASLGAALLHAKAPEELAEQQHTRYDPELGWVSAPNLKLPDLYGPGRSLTTNSRGFRGAAEVEDAPAPGRSRLICSGDSFTLGYGVADDEAWCARLAALVPGIEAVNMGQGGYGIDQAYLWYRRDGHSLPHQLHLLAVIHEDFARMGSDRFLGRSKPILTLVEGRLVPKNLPVPRDEDRRPWLERQRPWLEQLRAFVVLDGIARRVVGPPPSTPLPSHVPQLALRVFETLRDSNHARGSRFAVVYLPVPEDAEPGPFDAWREALRQDLAARGIPFLDVVQDFRQLPLPARQQMFLPEVAGGYRGAAGHYDAAGNARVAGWIAGHLTAAGLLPARSAVD